MQQAVSTAAILTVLREVDASTPEEVVTEVDEKDSAPEPHAPEKAAKRAGHRDALRQQMLAAGCHPERVDELVAAKQITGFRQRVTPTWATVCALETIAFWADRSDEQIEQDMTKLLRRDGGQKGPAALYAQIICDTITVNIDKTFAVELLHVDDAATRVNDHVGRRVYSARLYVTMAINELRRRRAVHEGLDAKSIKYLKVGPPSPTESDAIPVKAESEVNATSHVNEQVVDAPDPTTVGVESKLAELPQKSSRRPKAVPIPPLTDEEANDPEMAEALALTHGNVEHARAYLGGRHSVEDSAASQTHEPEEVGHG